MEYIPLLRVCLLIGGVLQMLLFLSIFHRTIKSKQWPKTAGRVLFSELYQLSRCDVDRKNTAYKAIVKYQYQIDGKTYFSRKIYYGDWIAISFSSYMKKIVKQYSIGAECIVHYNPQKAEKSVLKVTLATPVYSLLLAASLFIGMGVYLYFI